MLIRKKTCTYKTKPKIIIDVSCNSLVLAVTQFVSFTVSFQRVSETKMMYTKTPVPYHVDA